MKGGNVNEFIDHTTYEEEAVMYNGKKYFFHGIIYDPDIERCTYEIDLWDDRGWYVETVYSAVEETEKECMHKFLSEPIIEGKKFWDIEKDMEWVDW